jgi:hypothetical protein
MASLTLPTTSGLQIAMRATMLANELNIQRHWVVIEIELGASGSVQLYLYQNGIARWIVKSNNSTIFKQGTFRYKTGIVATNDSFEINIDWTDARLFVKLDGLPYLEGVGLPFPEDFTGAVFNLDVALFGGSGQEVLGVDYLDINSPGGGGTVPEAFWTSFDGTYEVL